MDVQTEIEARPPHRRDIDGLRAVAILGVLFYHLGLPGLTGGYGGVDIFFVISGFLITGILKAELEGGSFSIAQFYVRRIRRILPALIVVAIAVTVVATLLMFPDDFKNYGKSVLAVATSTSNFHFMRQTGYFDGAAIEKPMLHTWSLGIEEQFYAVFPLLLAALFRYGRKALVMVLVLIAATSLAVSVHDVEIRPAQAFFSTAGRIWELLAGAVLAFGVLPTLTGRFAREAEASLGAAMVAFGYCTYSDATAFPGLAALPFCAGAALIIHAGMTAPETLVARALSVPPAVGIGLISYSVYLWHWPLLVFVRYRFPDVLARGAPNLHVTVGGLAAASLALGYLSWRFVERPFRAQASSSSRAPVFGTATLATCVLVAFALAIIKSGGWPGRWPADIVVLTAEAKGNQPPLCTPLPAADGWPGDACRIGAGSGPATTVLWGDSHAGTLIPGFANSSAKSGFSMIAATYGGCPPLAGVTLYGRARSVRCRALNDRVIEKASAPGIKRVILAARWGLYAEGVRGDNDGGQPTYLSPGGVSENARVLAALLEDTVKRLAANGREVVIIGPVPEQTVNVMQALARHRAWKQPLPAETTLAAFTARQKHVLPLLERLEGIANVRVVYPHRWLCDTDVCRSSKNALPLYRDTNHLSEWGLADLDGMFSEIFATDAAQQAW